MGFRRGTQAAVLAALVLAGAARAGDQCPKLEGMWLTLTPTDQGYLLPMNVAGAQHTFQLELAMPFAKLDSAIARKLDLPIRNLPRGFKIFDSHHALTTFATAPIQLGQLVRHTQFLLEAHEPEWGPQADGVLGLNVLDGFDIELDLAHDKLGLFLPRPCPFVPYWPYTVVGSTAFDVSATGEFIIPMQLDGTRIEASLVTSEHRSTMSLEAAYLLLDIDDDNPGLKPSANWHDHDAFTYPFKTLKADDVVINNPAIVVYRSNSNHLCGGLAGDRYHRAHNEPRCIGGADVSLGIDDLKQLHLFFAFNEKKVYFTLAEPPVAPNPQ